MPPKLSLPALPCAEKVATFQDVRVQYWRLKTCHGQKEAILPQAMPCMLRTEGNARRLQYCLQHGTNVASDLKQEAKYSSISNPSNQNTYEQWSILAYQGRKVARAIGTPKAMSLSPRQKRDCIAAIRDAGLHPKYSRTLTSICEQTPTSGSGVKPRFGSPSHTTTRARSPKPRPNTFDPCTPRPLLVVETEQLAPRCLEVSSWFVIDKASPVLPSSLRSNSVNEAFSRHAPAFCRACAGCFRDAEAL